jgi:propanol-preferring alcohol dehydrogenase
MKAILIQDQCPLEEALLSPVEVPRPEPGAGELLLRISACGICHTDLHIIEGDLPLLKSPLIPGHQIVGTVVGEGPRSGKNLTGDRVGVPWANTTCGKCQHCVEGRENLCDNIRFTGYHIDGGFAEYVSVPAVSVYPLPGDISDVAAAPLLCAGIIGYRALRLSGAGSGSRIGLVGFGASAHLTIQVAKHYG